MKSTGVMLALFLACGCSHASEDLHTTLRSSVPVSDRLLVELAGSGPDILFDGPHALPVADTDDDLRLQMQAMMTTLWDKLIGAYGQPTGHELVRTERIGKTLVRNTYLLKLERNAVPIAVTLYRGRSGWIVTDVDTDADIDALFLPTQATP